MVELGIEKEGGKEGWREGGMASRGHREGRGYKVYLGSAGGKGGEKEGYGREGSRKEGGWIA